ncbi:MAG: hypothetical protein Q7S11_03850 [bacterium]|nr:hypothetical protein [bacterium]
MNLLQSLFVFFKKPRQIVKELSTQNVPEWYIILIFLTPFFLFRIGELVTNKITFGKSNFDVFLHSKSVIFDIKFLLLGVFIFYVLGYSLFYFGKMLSGAATFKQVRIAFLYSYFFGAVFLLITLIEGINLFWVYFPIVPAAIIFSQFFYLFISSMAEIERFSVPKTALVSIFFVIFTVLLFSVLYLQYHLYKENLYEKRKLENIKIYNEIGYPK